MMGGRQFIPQSAHALRSAIVRAIHRISEVNGIAIDIGDQTVQDSPVLVHAKTPAAFQFVRGGPPAAHDNQNRNAEENDGRNSAQRHAIGLQKIEDVMNPRGHCCHGVFASPDRYEHLVS